jgi:hypothetical protein
MLVTAGSWFLSGTTNLLSFLTFVDPEVNEAGDRPGKKKSMKSFVKEFIWEAYQKCRNNPALKQAGNRILTSDVFYNLRDAMQKEGWGEKGWNHPTMKRREKDSGAVCQ